MKLVICLSNKAKSEFQETVETKRSVSHCCPVSSPVTETENRTVPDSASEEVFRGSEEDANSKLVSSVIEEDSQEEAEMEASEDFLDVTELVTNQDEMGKEVKNSYKSENNSGLNSPELDEAL